MATRLERKSGAPGGDELGHGRRGRHLVLLVQVDVQLGAPDGAGVVGVERAVARVVEHLAAVVAHEGAGHVLDAVLADDDAGAVVAGVVEALGDLDEVVVGPGGGGEGDALLGEELLVEHDGLAAGLEGEAPLLALPAPGLELDLDVLGLVDLVADHVGQVVGEHALQAAHQHPVVLVVGDVGAGGAGGVLVLALVPEVGAARLGEQGGRDVGRLGRGGERLPPAAVDQLGGGRLDERDLLGGGRLGFPTRRPLGAAGGQGERRPAGARRRAPPGANSLIHPPSLLTCFCAPRPSSSSSSPWYPPRILPAEAQR